LFAEKAPRVDTRYTLMTLVYLPSEKYVRRGNADMGGRRRRAAGVSRRREGQAGSGGGGGGEWDERRPRAGLTLRHTGNHPPK